jgi:hypothetical protein
MVRILIRTSIPGDAARAFSLELAPSLEDNPTRGAVGPGGLREDAQERKP